MAAKPEHWIHFRCPICRRVSILYVYDIGVSLKCHGYSGKPHFESAVMTIPPDYDGRYWKWFLWNWL